MVTYQIPISRGVYSVIREYEKGERDYVLYKSSSKEFRNCVFFHAKATKDGIIDTGVTAFNKVTSIELLEKLFSACEVSQINTIYTVCDYGEKQERGYYSGVYILPFENIKGKIKTKACEIDNNSYAHVITVE